MLSGGRMALYKYHYIELDTKRSPRISLQNIVAGETGNRLWITVTNNGDVIDMSEKENDAWKYRVCLRIDSDLGTRRQDSAEANSGITFIDANTGDHGKINILLSKDSFTSGMNRAVLEIYSKRVNDNDTLICSAEWTFRAAKNPTGENAGTVYPSLIKYENDLRQLVSDAEDAIDACEEATEAANSAASSANSAASAANEAARDAGHAAQDATVATTAANTAASAANTAAQGADAAKVAANSAASTATSAAQAADGAAQNADAKAAEAEAAASAANEAAAAANAAAQIAKKGAYNIKHNATWSGSAAYGYTAETGAEITQLAQDNVFVTQIANPDADDQSVITLIEIGRDATSEVIFFRSAQAWDGYIYLATMDYSGNNTAADISFARQVGEPLMLHPTNVTYDLINNEILSVAFEESASQIIASFDRPMSFFISIPNPPDSGQGAVSNDYLVTVAYKSHYSRLYEMVFILNVPHEMGIYLTVSIVNNAVNARGTYSYTGL